MPQKTQSKKVSVPPPETQKQMPTEMHKYANGGLLYHCKNRDFSNCVCKGKALWKYQHMINGEKVPKEALKPCEGKPTCKDCKACK